MPKSTDQHITTSALLESIVHTVQSCVTKVIAQQLDGLQKEIASLKAVIHKQSNITQNKDSKDAYEVSLKQYTSKLSKLVKKNHKAIVAKRTRTGSVTMSDSALDRACSRLKSQLVEMRQDKRLCHAQLTIDDEPKHARELSPFDDMSRYDDCNIFNTDPATSQKLAASAATTTTIDQISALPAPPKTKVSKPAVAEYCNAVNTPKQVVKAVCVDNSSMEQQKRKSLRKRYRRNKHVVRKAGKTACNIVVESDRYALPIYHDTDWYQIVGSGSSGGEENASMSTEDVHKLDMLQSI